MQHRDFAVIAIFISPIDILLQKYLTKLHGSAATFGLLVSVRGVGSIIGLWLLPRIQRRVSIFMVGIASTMLNIPPMTQIDLALPENRRSRFHS